MSPRRKNDSPESRAEANLIRNGEAAAWGHLREALCQRMMCHVLNWADREEITHEALLSAWQKRDQLIGSNIQEILQRVMRFVENEMLKRKRRRRVLSTRVPLVALAREDHSQSDPIDDVILAETEDRLDGAAEGLSEALREVYDLRVEQRLLPQAIAVRLGLPLGVVTQRLERMRQQLRWAITKYNRESA